LKGFSKLTQKGALFFGKDGKVETYYIGNKKSSENKRSLIRIYNKKEDILKK
jgi:DNA relaxase NicK